MESSTSSRELKSHNGLYYHIKPYKHTCFLKRFLVLYKTWNGLKWNGTIWWALNRTSYFLVDLRWKLMGELKCTPDWGIHHQVFSMTVCKISVLGATGSSKMGICPDRPEPRLLESLSPDPPPPPPPPPLKNHKNTCIGFLSNTVADPLKVF